MPLLTTGGLTQTFLTNISECCWDRGGLWVFSATGPVHFGTAAAWIFGSTWCSNDLHAKNWFDYKQYESKYSKCWIEFSEKKTWCQLAKCFILCETGEVNLFYILCCKLQLKQFYWKKFQFKLGVEFIFTFIEIEYMRFDRSQENSYNCNIQISRVLE